MATLPRCMLRVWARRAGLAQRTCGRSPNPSLPLHPGLNLHGKAPGSVERLRCSCSQRSSTYTVADCRQGINHYALHRWSSEFSRRCCNRSNSLTRP